MLLLKVKIGLIIMSSFLNSILENTPVQNHTPQTLVAETNSIQENRGYAAVEAFKNGFIAVGTDGRIDHISIAGEITETENFPEINFNCITATDQFKIAAGEKGNAVISQNKQPFKKIESGTKNSINTITAFDEFVIAGTDFGELLIGDEEGFFQMIRLKVKGNITSLSSREDKCFGVTDEGEVIQSDDGLNWEVFDFNEAYAGYYKPCSFKKVLATKNSIAVIGIHEDGTPVALSSNLGNVWTERTLNYSNENGIDTYLEDTPNDIYYDQLTDEYYLLCDNGRIVTLPNCSHCNSATVISDKNLKGMAFNQETFIVVGEDFFIECFNIK